MSTSIYDTYPPQVSEDQLAYLVQTVKDWSIEHGLTVRPNPSFVSEEVDPNHVLATNAPVTLFPSPFPKVCFDQARRLQATYNQLYAAIAADEQWLHQTLKETIEVDDFLSTLWRIHLQVKEEGYVQDISLGMFRSDYMLHIPSTASPPSLKQVEFNTISSSFGGLAALVSRMHKELVNFPGPPSPSAAYPAHPLFNSAEDGQKSESLRITSNGVPPDNEAVETLVSGLVCAHKAYGTSRSSPPLPLCILFLVQDNERNLFDQLALSSYLFDTNKIPSYRLPVSKILVQTTIPSTSTNPNRPLIYTSASGQVFEATVVYLRALYAPSEYNPSSTAGRHHLERSAAIKCPTILLQLSGSKKIQQVLTKPAPSHLERFLPDHSADVLQELRDSFAPQYSMSTSDPGEDSSTAGAGIAIALDPALAEKHVLKPQREGGGNNIYRGSISTFLKSIPESSYKQYILMELIQPPVDAKNTVLRSDGEVVSGNVISELGIFGTCVWKNHTEGEGHDSKKAEVLFNNKGGYLLRTKGKESDEGGVAAGFSSLDSLILYEEQG